MRIDLNAGQGTTQASLEKPSLEKSSASRSTAAATESGSESRFSSQQASVSRLAATVLAAPEVRQEKLQALQQQIRDGNYQVSASQVAASLFQHLLR